MSTRCQIGFYEEGKRLDKPEALIYRHSDGYPEGVLPDIMPFLSWWAKGRGISDIEYCSARLLQYMCNKYDQFAQENFSHYEHMQKELEDAKTFTGLLGHGISTSFHGDIEFIYAVKPDGVHVFEVVYDEKTYEPKINESKLLGVIPYENFEASADYKKLTTRN